MNVLVQPRETKPEARQRFVRYGVDWPGYEKTLAIVGERQVRVT